MWRLWGAALLCAACARAQTPAPTAPSSTTTTTTTTTADVSAGAARLRSDYAGTVELVAQGAWCRDEDDFVFALNFVNN